MVLRIATHSLLRSRNLEKDLLLHGVAAEEFRKAQDAAYADYTFKMEKLEDDMSNLMSDMVYNQTFYEYRSILEELAAAQVQITQDYYFAIRDMSAAAAGVKLPEYTTLPDTDASRALWKYSKGLSNTDYNGLTYGQVLNGQSRAGITLDDVWRFATQNFSVLDSAQWESLGSDILHYADRLHAMRLTESDPSKPRYARVPTGATTCAFCTMLASRGYVYKTEESAGGGWRIFHPHDDCMIIPSWNKQNLAHYNPDKLYGMVKQAEECAHGRSEVLANLRSMFPAQISDGHVTN